MQSAMRPKGILKQPVPMSAAQAYDVIRKSKSVELLDDGGGRIGTSRHVPACSLDRAERRRSSAPPSPCRSAWNWRMNVLEEKVRFSNFLDEITCRVLSPARLTLLGRKHRNSAPWRSHSNQPVEPPSTGRTRRWDDWAAALHRPDTWYQPPGEEGAGREREPPQGDVTEGAGPKEEVHRGVKMEAEDIKESRRQRPPLSNMSLLSHIKVGTFFTSSSSFCYLLLCFFLLFLLLLLWLKLNVQRMISVTF